MRFIRAIGNTFNKWTLLLLAMTTPLLMGGGCDSDFDGGGGVADILEGVWYLVSGILELVD